MNLVDLKISDSLVIALLGYAVVFVGLILLMWVIMLMSRYFIAKGAKVSVKVEEMPSVENAQKAKGTAGEVKLYDTDPRDAAMVMAIIADELDTPLNELRFISIKEVKE